MNEGLRDILLDMLINQSRALAGKEGFNGKLQVLLQRKELWGTAHFEILSEMMDWSLASVKRLFGRPGHKAQKALYRKSEHKICDFLGFRNWDELTSALLKKHETQVYVQSQRRINAMYEELASIEKEMKLLCRRIEQFSSQFEQTKEEKTNKTYNTHNVSEIK